MIYQMVPAVIWMFRLSTKNRRFIEVISSLQFISSLLIRVFKYKNQHGTFSISSFKILTALSSSTTDTKGICHSTYYLGRESSLSNFDIVLHHPWSHFSLSFQYRYSTFSLDTLQPSSSSTASSMMIIFLSADHSARVGHCDVWAKLENMIFLPR